MHSLIDDIAIRSGFDPAVAERATTLVAAHLVDNGPKKPLATLRRHVPELDALAEAGRACHETLAQTRRGGLLGRLGDMARGGGVATAVGALLGGAEGGGIAKLMVLVGDLGRVGLDIGDMKTLARAMIAHLRMRAGDEVVDDLLARLTAKLPAVARHLG